MPVVQFLGVAERLAKKAETISPDSFREEFRRILNGEIKLPAMPEEKARLMEEAWEGELYYETAQETIGQWRQLTSELMNNAEEAYGENSKQTLWVKDQVALMRAKRGELEYSLDHPSTKDILKRLSAIYGAYKGGDYEQGELIRRDKQVGAEIIPAFWRAVTLNLQQTNTPRIS
jgi:hypothetical protein